MSGNIELIQAIKSNHLDEVKQLLEPGKFLFFTTAPRAHANASYGQGASPLYWAVTRKNVEIVKLLIAKGARVNEMNPSYGSPLLEACKVGSEEIIEILLKNGASVHAEDDIRWTPLLRASLKGNLKLVKRLISRGAQVNPQNPNLGVTPLHLAVESCKLDVVELLLSKGARVNAKTTAGKTPLRQAGPDGKIAKLLKSHGGRL